MMFYARLSPREERRNAVTMLQRLPLLLFLCASPAVAAEGAAVAITYESCAVCHGGGGSEHGIPSLDGLGEDKLRERMTAFRDGTGGSTIMHRFMVGLDPAEIERLARHVADRTDAER